MTVWAASLCITYFLFLLEIRFLLLVFIIATWNWVIFISYFSPGPSLIIVYLCQSLPYYVTHVVETWVVWLWLMRIASRRKFIILLRQCWQVTVMAEFWSRFWNWNFVTIFETEFCSKLWGWILVLILKLNSGQEFEADV